MRQYPKFVTFKARERFLWWRFAEREYTVKVSSIGSVTKLPNGRGYSVYFRGDVDGFELSENEYQKLLNALPK